MFSSLIAASISDVGNEVVTYVQIITNITLSICAMLILVYGVYIGFKFMKAEDESKRKEAKTHPYLLYRRLLGCWCNFGDNKRHCSLDFRARS